MVAVGGAALAGLSVPFRNASAQAVPTPPMVIYGDAPGATPGQPVYGIVTMNGVATTCGQGLVVDDGGPRYVVTVVAEGQTPGCGAAGRTVELRVGSPSPSGGSRWVAAWESGKGTQVNLTPAEAVTVRARAALVAKAP